MFEECIQGKDLSSDVFNWNLVFMQTTSAQGTSARRLPTDVLESLCQASRGTRGDRIVIVREGIPGEVVPVIAARLHWSQTRLFETLGLARTSIRRHVLTGSRLGIRDSERLLAMVDLVVMAEEMKIRADCAEGFDSAQWLGAWLLEPCGVLGGKTPASYLDTLEGCELVGQLLMQIEHGTYA